MLGLRRFYRDYFLPRDFVSRVLEGGRGLELRQFFQVSLNDWDFGRTIFTYSTDKNPLPSSQWTAQMFEEMDDSERRIYHFWMISNGKIVPSNSLYFSDGTVEIHPNDVGSSLVFPLTVDEYMHDGAICSYLVYTYF